MIERINATTFRSNDLGDVKPVVLIGGVDASRFIPNINISCHDDEFFIKAD